MKEIKLYSLESIAANKIDINKPHVIAGEPCEQLLELQKTGYCILAELKMLQGLEEEETAEALTSLEEVLLYKNVCISSKGLPKAYFRRIWSNHVGEPVTIAETDRLIVRESIPEDGAAFFKLYQDEECRKFLEKPPVEQEVTEQYENYIKEYQAGQYGFYEYGMWSVIKKADKRVVGRAGLEQQDFEKNEEGVLGLGYAVLPEFRGKGYAIEACKAILEYCRECDYAKKVHVRIHQDNKASWSVYRQLKEHSTVELNCEVLQESNHR